MPSSLSFTVSNAPPNRVVTVWLDNSLVAELNFRGNGEVNVDRIIDASRECEQMQGHLLRVFASTESVVNQLMLRIIKPCHSRYEFLDAWLVRSSLLTLESKKKCVLQWDTRSKYFSDPGRKRFDKLFVQFIRNRNMVVHGSAYADDNYELWLDFFSGTPQREKLSKQFSDTCIEELLELQKLLREFDESIFQSDKLETPTPPAPSTPTVVRYSGFESPP